MAAGIGELFIELSFKGNPKGAKEFKDAVDELSKKFGATLKLSNKTDNSIFKLTKRFKAVTLSILGAIYALNRITDSLLNSNQAWIDFSRQTDLAMEKLQGYAAVANVLDKSLGMEGAAQGIANLEQRMYELQLTGQGAEGFLYAGINPIGKNAFQVLEELRNRIKGLNNNQATFLLKQMGLDPKMLAMLRMTREEFEALNAELKKYQLTEEQRKAMQKYQEQLSIATKKIAYFKDRAILAILPSIEKLAQSFARVVEGLKNYLQWGRDVYENLSDIDKAGIKLSLIISGIIAMVLAFMANPAIAAFVTVLTAIYLIIDDIMIGLQGGDSYFRDFLNWANKFVQDENEPKWLRDLVFVITNADRLKNVISDTSKKNAEFETNHPYMSKLVPTVTGVNRWINLYDSIKTNGTDSSGKVGNVIIHQTNTINTTEAALEVEENLKHAQFTAAGAAGN